MGGWWWLACVPCAVLLCQRRRWGLSIDNPIMATPQSVLLGRGKRGDCPCRWRSIGHNQALGRAAAVVSEHTQYLHTLPCDIDDATSKQPTRMRAIGRRSSPSIGRPFASACLVGFLKGLLGSASADCVGVPCTCRDGHRSFGFRLNARGRRRRSYFTDNDGGRFRSAPAACFGSLIIYTVKLNARSVGAWVVSATRVRVPAPRSLDRGATSVC